MGKKINFQVCDDIRMFQVFKEYVRVNENNVVLRYNYGHEMLNDL